MEDTSSSAERLLQLAQDNPEFRDALQKTLKSMQEATEGPSTEGLSFDDLLDMTIGEMSANMNLNG